MCNLKKLVRNRNLKSRLHCIDTNATVKIFIFLGIIPRAIVHIFEGKEADEDQELKCLVSKILSSVCLEYKAGKLTEKSVNKRKKSLIFKSLTKHIDRF